MCEVRFVAAGDHHGGAVAGADIGQRQDDIALAAAEHAVGVVVSPAQCAAKTARMNRVVAAGAAHRRIINRAQNRISLQPPQEV